MTTPTSSGDAERLLEVLRDDPQRLAELRALLGIDDWARVTEALEHLTEAQTGTEERLAALTERVDQLTETVDRLTERVDRLAERMGQLAERMDQLTERMGQLTERMGELTERMDRLTERVDELAVAQRGTQDQLTSLVGRVDDLARSMSALTDRVSSLTEQVSTLTGHVDWLRGDAIERRYRERGPAYFGPIAKGLAPLSWPELNEVLDAAIADSALSDDEAEQVRQADAILRGRDRDDGTELYLVVEASYGVGMDDVQRALERAALLHRTGVRTVPVVAGTWFVPEADRAASAYGVWRVTDGRALAPAS